MDNFGGAAAWDAYCYEQDQLLKYDMKNTKCFKCELFLEEGCLCLATGETVDPEKYAIDYGCEDVIPL